jgi:hypothetical protein
VNTNRARWVSPGQTERSIRDATYPQFSVRVEWKPGREVQIATVRSEPFDVDGATTDGIYVSLDDTGIDALIATLRHAKRRHAEGSGDD